MKLLRFLVFLPVLLALDYSEEAKKFIDYNVDPCDDFYRHVCRMDSPDFLAAQIGNMILSENLNASRTNAKTYSEFEELENDNKDQVAVRTVPDLISSTYESICGSNLDVAAFLEELEEIFDRGQCQDLECFTHLANDPDCKRVAAHIKSVFVATTEPVSTANIANNINEVIRLVRSLDSFWAEDDLSRENEFQSYFQDIKSVTAELIMETPWAINHNVSQMILSVLDRVIITNFLENIKAKRVNWLKEVNLIYSECKLRYSTATWDLITQYCLLFAFEKTVAKTDRQERIDMSSAFLSAQISYPKIEMGFVWYQMYLTTRNRVARLGSPGFTMAHELSHALIKGTEGDILSYFSEEAKQCIQEQYRSSCKYFDEGDCQINEDQFEENGADVFAVQIIWKLFENQFANGDFDEMESSEKLKQLFYAMGTNLCSGGEQVFHALDPHAPSNIRINAFVNHPAFQKAFQCSDDSRMMKSKTKQCSVYGEHAPPNRHRRYSLTVKNLIR